MSRLDDLPPDQRAVLSLLVQQGKSHAEIAEMLGIPQSTVRDRARAALSALSAATDEIHSATPKPTRDLSSSLPSSRRGGALLLAVLVVVVVVAIILITDGGGSHKDKTSATTSATTPSTTTTSSGSSTSSTPQNTGTATANKQITLTSPEPNSKTIGQVEVLSQGAQHAYVIAAKNLPPTKGFFYAIWLYNSPTSALPVNKLPSVNSSGGLQGDSLLPATAGNYHKILLTRETSSKPTHPGPIVLSGSFALH
jgi:hypothetical protein